MQTKVNNQIIRYVIALELYSLVGALYHLIIIIAQVCLKELITLNISQIWFL